MYQQPPPKKLNPWIVIGVIVALFVIYGAVLNTTKTEAIPRASSTLTSSTHTSTTKQATVVTTRAIIPIVAPTKVVALTHGTPHIGGLYTDFVGKYGQPTSEGIGGSKNFFGDSDQTIILNVSSNNGKVIAMSIIGDIAWSINQTETYCHQFLPRDAQQFNWVKSAINTLVDYRSSVGEVVLSVVDQGSVTITIAQG